jgi:alpha-glucosidase
MTTVLTVCSGNDIADLVLEVQYQTQERLNVKLYPKNIVPANSSQFILPTSIVPAPEWDGSTTKGTSDLKLDWR